MAEAIRMSMLAAEHVGERQQKNRMTMKERRLLFPHQPQWVVSGFNSSFQWQRLL